MGMLLYARAGSLPSSSWGWVRPAPRPFNSLCATWVRQANPPCREDAHQAVQRSRCMRSRWGRSPTHLPLAGARLEVSTALSAA